MKTANDERVQTGIRLPATLVKDVKHLSLDLGRSYTSLIEEALNDLLAKYKSQG